jgi:hypothetical protein
LDSITTSNYLMGRRTAPLNTQYLAVTVNSEPDKSADICAIGILNERHEAGREKTTGDHENITQTILTHVNVTESQKKGVCIQVCVRGGTFGVCK